VNDAIKQDYNPPWEKCFSINTNHMYKHAMSELHNLKYKWFSHPPYSPELAYSDYYLFSNLKKLLGCKKFGWNLYVTNAILLSHGSSFNLFSCKEHKLHYYSNKFNLFFKPSFKIQSRLFNLYFKQEIKFNLYIIT